MSKGELKEKEPHPMAGDAYIFVKAWIAEQSYKDLAIFKEVLERESENDNRLAEVCGETFDRVARDMDVSDVYVLGLAWFIRNFMDTMSWVKKSECCGARMVMGGLQCEACGSNGKIIN